MPEKSQESEPISRTVYDPEKVVFSVHTSHLKGKTQCTKHQWRKLSENEVYCPLCESALIVKNIEDYV